MNTIGNYIRKIRELTDLTQEYMAEKLHITQGAYSNLEKGNTKANIERVTEIATIFDIKIEDILHFNEKPFFNNPKSEIKKNY